MITVNRLSRASTAGTELGVYDDQDRLVSYAGAQYQYSLSGELTHRIVGTDTTRYTYDALGALRSVKLPDGTQIDYVIDALGRRIGRKVNGNFTHRFIYESNLRIAAEVDASGEVTTRYVYGEKSNVPEYMVRAGVFYRLVTDHLGSVRLVIRASTGQVFQRTDYDEFGRVVADSNPSFQPFGFAGGLRDQLTQLVRFGARDYDPETGRFLTKDPIGLQDGVNVYSYARFDPVNYVDPTGLQPCPEDQADGTPGDDPENPDNQADGHKDPPERIICSEAPSHPACSIDDKPLETPTVSPVDIVAGLGAAAAASLTARIAAKLAATRAAAAAATNSSGGRLVTNAAEGFLGGYGSDPGLLSGGPTWPTTIAKIFGWVAGQLIPK